MSTHSHNSNSSPRGSSASADQSATRTLMMTPASSPTSLQITEGLLDLGLVFDEFELVRFLGNGGMGQVYLASDANLNRTVALKVLYPEKVTNEEVIQRFRSEAQAMAALNHPNVVQVYAFRDHPEIRQMYLVMEYVPGVNIRDQINATGALSVALTVTYALQIAHALAHLNARHIVHRDIKPSNILITEDENAKLIDFGLARLYENGYDAAIEENERGNDITASGVTLGTFDYISPEQARDPRFVDIRSDIYSLGCTLYFMLTGNPPFPQGNPLQKLLQHQSDNPLDIHLHRSDVPESLNQVLQRAMKKNPDERYAGPEAMLEDLEQVAAELNLSPKYGFGLIHHALQTTEAEKDVSLLRWDTLQRSLFWIIPLAVLLVALLVLSWIWQPNTEELQIPSQDLPPAVEPNGSSDAAAEYRNSKDHYVLSPRTQPKEFL